MDRVCIPKCSKQDRPQTVSTVRPKRSPSTQHPIPPYHISFQTSLHWVCRVEGEEKWWKFFWLVKGFRGSSQFLKEDLISILRSHLKEAAVSVDSTFCKKEYKPLCTPLSFSECALYRWGGLSELGKQWGPLSLESGWILAGKERLVLTQSCESQSLLTDPREMFCKLRGRVSVLWEIRVIKIKMNIYWKSMIYWHHSRHWGKKSMEWELGVLGEEKIQTKISNSMRLIFRMGVRQ